MVFICIVSTHCVHLLIDAKEYLCHHKNLSYMSYGDLVSPFDLLRVFHHVALSMMCSQTGKAQHGCVGRQDYKLIVGGVAAWVLYRVCVVLCREHGSGEHSLDTCIACVDRLAFVPTFPTCYSRARGCVHRAHP